MNARIGVMQGRLTPQIGEAIQAFPRERWRDEFPLAAREGFAVMEWVFEEAPPGENPLMTPAGQAEIRRLSAAHRVEVESVCADYFMKKPLTQGPPENRRAARDTLRRLIGACARLNVRLLEIPLVDRSRLSSADEHADLLGILMEAAPLAEAAGIAITLETDLPPNEFRRLLEASPKNVKANFDMGNSASLGYDPAEEIKTIGPWIANVHVKDRGRGGTTVPLGQGAVDFETVFKTLAEIGYQGSYILQTARDLDDVGAARRYRRMTLDWLKAPAR